MLLMILWGLVLVVCLKFTIMLLRRVDFGIYPFPWFRFVAVAVVGLTLVSWVGIKAVDACTADQTAKGKTEMEARESCTDIVQIFFIDGPLN